MHRLRTASVLGALLGVVVLAGLTAPASGQTAARNPLLAPMGAGVVTDIRIEGSQRIEAETIRSYLLIEPGDVWDD